MSSCLLAKLSNFCQLLLPMPFLTTFGSIWQLLATFVILLYCPLVILSSRHSVLFSSCQSGSLSICQLVNFLACELLSLWTFQIVHLGACELVLHITSMISFGGFLAECLPCFSFYFEASCEYLISGSHLGGVRNGAILLRPAGPATYYAILYLSPFWWRWLQIKRTNAW